MGQSHGRRTKNKGTVPYILRNGKVTTMDHKAWGGHGAVNWSSTASFGPGLVEIYNVGLTKPFLTPGREVAAEQGRGALYKEVGLALLKFRYFMGDVFRRYRKLI